MWSVLAEACAINRQIIADFPAGVQEDMAERLGELRRQAWHLGIDLEIETKWMPPADMTHAEAEDQLAKAERALTSIGATLEDYFKPPISLVRQYDELRAYRDRLQDVMRGEL